MFDWIVAVIEQGGYAGIVFLTLIENVFPPIPSELIIPFAGFVAARGDLDFSLVVASGTLGSVLGALFWYYVAVVLGIERLRRWVERHGRWITVSAHDLDRAQAWFLRYAGPAVFIGRLVPGIRSYISVPAGLVRMSMVPFLLFTTVGTALWTALLASAGLVLDHEYARIADYLDPVSNIVFLAILAHYLYRVVTYRR